MKSLPGLQFKSAHRSHFYSASPLARRLRGLAASRQGGTRVDYSHNGFSVHIVLLFDFATLFHMNGLLHSDLLTELPLMKVLREACGQLIVFIRDSKDSDTHRQVG